jgi:hypothetical protein
LTHIPSFNIFPPKLPNPKSAKPVNFGMRSSHQKAQLQGDVIDLGHNKQVDPNLKAPKPVHFGADNPPTYGKSQVVAQLKKALIGERAKLSKKQRGKELHYKTVTKICNENPSLYSILSNTDRLQVVCEVMRDEIR